MFYKFENNQLTESDFVQFPDSTFLHLDFLDTYELPIEGWYYFATPEEARSFWNLPEPEVPVP